MTKQKQIRGFCVGKLVQANKLENQIKKNEDYYLDWKRQDGVNVNR